jgi:hypothetical protein
MNPTRPWPRPDRTRLTIALDINTEPLIRQLLHARLVYARTNTEFQSALNEIVASYGRELAFKVRNQ